LKQAAIGASVPGALTRPDDRLLILVGHDTNLVNISGALHISWLMDGRLDDTPPGGALVFLRVAGISTDCPNWNRSYFRQVKQAMRSS
jgi:hypothetical protein